MSSVSILGDTSGSVLLQAPAIAGSTTVNIGATSGTLQAGAPAFYAYNNADQSVTNSVNTKMSLNTELFDTNNCFDTSTYRFTPNVAGYYLLTLCVWVGNTSSLTRWNGKIYKNGSEYFRVQDLLGTQYGTSGSTLMYMNGTTDYAEAYVNINGTSPSLLGNNSFLNNFQGVWVRGA